MHGLAKKLEKRLSKRERKALRKESIERLARMQYDSKEVHEDFAIMGTTPFSRTILSELAKIGWRRPVDPDYD